MRCSHNIPYESKCANCVQEALQRVQRFQQAPVPTATKEQRSVFWQQAYRNQLPVR